MAYTPMKVWGYLGDIAICKCCNGNAKRRRRRPTMASRCAHLRIHLQSNLRYWAKIHRLMRHRTLKGHCGRHFEAKIEADHGHAEPDKSVYVGNREKIQHVFFSWFMHTRRLRCYANIDSERVPSKGRFHYYARSWLVVTVTTARRQRNAR